MDCQHNAYVHVVLLYTKKGPSPTPHSQRVPGRINGEFDSTTVNDGWMLTFERLACPETKLLYLHNANGKPSSGFEPVTTVFSDAKFVGRLVSQILMMTTTER